MPTDDTIIAEIPFQPSTIETIDQAVFDFIDKDFNVFSTTNKGWKKTPVIWVAGERAYQIKRDKGLRDLNGTLILPIITIERTGITKSMSKRGVVNAHLPSIGDAKGSPDIVYARRVQQDKTNNFRSADAKRRYAKQLNFPGKDFKTGPYQAYKSPGSGKIVYEYISMPLPVYLDMTYSITLRSEYQQQINEMSVPFMTRTGNINQIMIEQEGHFYEAFFQQEFAQTNNLSNLEQEERTYETKIDIKVLGYVQGSDKNDEQPKIVIRESAAEFKFQREHVMLGDDIDRIPNAPNLAIKPKVGPEPGEYRS